MKQSDAAPPRGLTSRRGALALSLVVLGAACSSTKSKSDPKTLGEKKLGVSASLPEGEVVDFEYPEGHAAFVVRLGRRANGGIGPDGDIVAFHRACPHQGCPLTEINIDGGELGPCGCHLSLFDLTRGGAQLSGLSSQNLVQVELVERDQEIFATGIVGLPYGDALTTEHATASEESS